MIDHPINRPHVVENQIGDFLYTLYKLLFDTKGLSLRTKQRTFEVASDSKSSWRVVSISHAALEHIRETRSAKGLQRGHILSRMDRAKQIFECENPLSREELLNYFFEHDTVALITKAENAKDGVSHWSQLYAVPENLFNAGSFSIYVRKGKELIWVDQLKYK